MIEAFLEVKEGKRGLTDPIVLRGDEKVFGSGAFHFMHAGLQLTLEDTIWNMMLFSDNTATNLMIDALGTAAVNDRLKRLGLESTWLTRDRPATNRADARQSEAVRAGQDDSARHGPAARMARALRAADEGICRRPCGSCAISRKDHARAIPRDPDPTEEETPLYVAAKLGALDQVRNEVGIIYTKAGRNLRSRRSPGTTRIRAGRRRTKRCG